jgi:hypothetical protein
VAKGEMLVNQQILLEQLLRNASTATKFQGLWFIAPYL